jgi:5'-deoxynucleotidase YfbR-like HD superfamily hydrolase
MNSKSENIGDLSKQIKALNDEAYRSYKPIAEELCNGQASEADVEFVLDRMLDFCGSNEILAMFKKICKCYFELYPEMITFEINAYRERWDTEQD